MEDLIRNLRSALELQQAIQGDLVPLLGGIPPETLRADPETPSGSAPGRAANTRADHTEPSAFTDDIPEMNNVDLFGNPIDPANDPSLTPYQRLEALIPEDSPLREMSSLAEVEAYVAGTVLIPLDSSRTNPVFGVGDPESDVLIIGEAPGAEEDKKGEPFVGRAGQLLNKILAAIEFRREEVYIANILKSRPPDNRDPLPEEVEAHLPILYKQIALIQPRLILCVGKTAGNTLLGRKSSLGSLRGTFHDFYGVPTLVTYHPAALLRNPQWKRPTWEDVQLLRTRYDQLP